MKKMVRNAKIKELVQIAHQKGLLTFEDIHRVLPKSVVSSDEIESFLILLRSMEIRIEDAEKDKAQELKEQKQKKKEEDAAKSEILDDPVRMYLKQMGQVPLLSRKQEVVLAKRIEEAALQLKINLYRFGNVSNDSVLVMRRLLAGKERFDRVVQDKFVANKNRYIKNLNRLCNTIESLDKKLATMDKDLRKRLTKTVMKNKTKKRGNHKERTG